ncbi:MAG: hypothetical protein RLZZ338_4129, partial [Cyanobacteriota bacterium]
MGIKDFTEPAFELSESLIYGWEWGRFILFADGYQRFH